MKVKDNAVTGRFLKDLSQAHQYVMVSGCWGHLTKWWCESMTHEMKWYLKGWVSWIWYLCTLSILSWLVVGWGYFLRSMGSGIVVRPNCYGSVWLEGHGFTAWIFFIHHHPGFRGSIHTSASLISSLSSMLSTVRHPWLMLSYKPASSFTSNFSK